MAVLPHQCRLDFISACMKIKVFIKKIHNICISRQDAAPTIDIEMWDPAKRENN